MALRLRCFGHRFLKGVNNLSDFRKETTRGMGFSGLLELKCKKFHIDLCMWLVNMVNVANHRIDLGDGRQIGLSCHEVGIVMGIPHRSHRFLIVSYLVLILELMFFLSSSVLLGLFRCLFNSWIT